MVLGRYVPLGCLDNKSSSSSADGRRQRCPAPKGFEKEEPPLPNLGVFRLSSHARLIWECPKSGGPFSVGPYSRDHSNHSVFGSILGHPICGNPICVSTRVAVSS